VWVAGASGFVGWVVVRRLVERGDEVIAPVRQRLKAAALTELGATVIEDDLTDVRRMADVLREVDAVVHAAGAYRVGVPKPERGAMWDANIGLTTRILDAAEAAKVGRLVYVSTCNVFGDTRGEVVDETYRRDVQRGFLSWYDETKFGAHAVVEQRIRGGMPALIVLPSQAYGPGDRSAVGDQLRRAHDGRLRVRVLDDVGLGFVHVDDLAAGIVAALDRGGAGQSYVLSGPHARLADALAIAARLGGHDLPPRLPTGVLRAAVPIAGSLGRPGLAEVVAAGDGVTYWASPRKAAAELGFEARSIEDGLRATFGSGS
jgi:dihydroflavonol-4-reductase